MTTEERIKSKFQLEIKLDDEIESIDFQNAHELQKWCRGFAVPAHTFFTLYASSEEIHCGGIDEILDYIDTYIFN